MYQWVSHHNVTKQHPNEEHAQEVNAPADDVCRRAPGLQKEISWESHRHSSWKNVLKIWINDTCTNFQL